MYRSRLYSQSDRRDQWSGAGRDDLHMACTSCNRKYDWRSSKCRQSDKYNRNTYQYNEFTTDSDIYNNTGFTGRTWRLYRYIIHINGNGQSKACYQSNDGSSMQRSKLY